MRRIFVAAAVVVACGIVVYSGWKALSLRDRLAALEQREADSASQLQQLTQERDEATNQVTVLSQELAKRNGSDPELLRLRGEIGFLRQQLLSGSNSTGRPIVGNSAQMGRDPLLFSAMALQQLFQQYPEKNIPETQYLGPDDWFEISRRKNLPLTPQSEDELHEALSAVRQQAKLKFAKALSNALGGYIKANAGTLPTDISQLAPFMRGDATQPAPPADDSVLQRYQIIKTGNAGDLKSNESVLAEKAAVDDQYDTLFSIGLNNYTMNGVGRNTTQGRTSWSTAP